MKGSKLYQPPPIRQFDKNFNLDTETFEKEVDLPLTATLAPDAKGAVELTAQVRYQACNDRQCLPPRKKTASFTVMVDPAAAAPAAFVVPAGYTEIKPGAVAVKVISAGAPAGANTGGLPAFLITAFGLGLAAIFTPCVFPMIPITVSFFLNQRGGILQAVVFSSRHRGFVLRAGAGRDRRGGAIRSESIRCESVGERIHHVGLRRVRAQPVGSLSKSRCRRACSPNSTRLRGAAATSGTLLMGLTFALTSFACIGPFMGSLLVASVQSKGLQPVLGMVSFAGGLASPFFFLAAFPSYLKKAAEERRMAGAREGGDGIRAAGRDAQVRFEHRSGFAVGLDHARAFPGRLVRAVHAGRVVFAGLLKLEGNEEGDHLGIGRLMVASVLLIFAFSLLPGMFGAPLGELDAYVPAASGGVLGNRASAEQVWMKNQYQEALDQARAENKLVLVTFTGYACTNCHWMKANMFPRPEIAEAAKKLVLVELYTDGTDKESEENQKLQDEKFSTVAIPYYAILDPDGKVVASFAKGMTKDTREFLAFLTARPA